MGSISIAPAPGRVHASPQTYTLYRAPPAHRNQPSNMDRLAQSKSKDGQQRAGLKKRKAGQRSSGTRKFRLWRKTVACNAMLFCAAHAPPQPAPLSPRRILLIFAPSLSKRRNTPAPATRIIAAAGLLRSRAAYIASGSSIYTLAVHLLLPAFHAWFSALQLFYHRRA